MLHYVELCSNDTGIPTIQQRPWDWKRNPMQYRQYPKLPVNLNKKENKLSNYIEPVCCGIMILVPPINYIRKSPLLLLCLWRKILGFPPIIWAWIRAGSSATFFDHLFCFFLCIFFNISNLRLVTNYCAEKYIPYVPLGVVVLEASFSEQHQNHVYLGSMLGLTVQI